MAARNENTLQGPVLTVLGQLGEIKAADEVVEKKRKQTGTAALVLGIGGFALMFCLPPIGGISMVAAVVFIVLYIKNVRRDLDDDRLDLAEELIASLRPDLSEKAPVEVVIRHGDPFQFGTTSNQRSEGSMLGGKVNYSDHEDTWFSFRGKLADGSTLKLEVSTSGKRKSKPKRKYTKINDRMQDEVSLVLRVPEGEYPHLDRLQGALRPDLLQQYGELTPSGFGMQAGLIRLSASTPQRTAFTGRSGRTENGTRLAARHLVSLLAFVYGGLGACRGESPAGKGS